MVSTEFKGVGLHDTAFRDAIREDSRQTTPSRGVTPRKKFAVEANVESRVKVAEIVSKSLDLRNKQFLRSFIVDYLQFLQTERGCAWQHTSKRRTPSASRRMTAKATSRRSRSTRGRHDALQPVDPDTGEVPEGSARLRRGDREEYTGNVQVIGWIAEA